jgi:hypothetical protein
MSTKKVQKGGSQGMGAGEGEGGGEGDNLKGLSTPQSHP